VRRNDPKHESPPRRKRRDTIERILALEIEPDTIRNASDAARLGVRRARVCLMKKDHVTAKRVLIAARRIAWWVIQVTRSQGLKDSMAGTLAETMRVWSRIK